MLISTHQLLRFQVTLHGFYCRSEVHQKMPLPLATLMKSTEPWADEYFALDLFAAMAEAGFDCLEYAPVNKRHRVMLGVAN